MVPLDSNLKQAITGIGDTLLARHMGSTDLLDFMGRGTLESYEAGELIIHEGDTSSDMFVILSGSAIIEMAGNETDIYVCTLGTGEILGEAGLFLRKNRTATVRASEGMKLIRITRASFFDFLRTNPQGGIKFLFLVIYGLLGRLRESNEELVFDRRLNMNQGDIDQLVAELIPSDTLGLLDPRENQL